MKKLILLLSLFLLFATGCKTELSDRPTGIYVEKSPIALRTTMNFTSDRKVSISYIDGTTKEFSYSVGEMMMTLSPLNVANYPAQNIFYHYTDTNQFELGNIYDPQGEAMVFIRPPAPK